MKPGDRISSLHCGSDTRSNGTRLAGLSACYIAYFLLAHREAFHLKAANAVPTFQDTSWIPRFFPPFSR
jgi:hypothetical protein